MEVIKKLVKFIIVLFVLLIVFNFLEYGFSWDKHEKLIFPTLLAIIGTLSFFIPLTRRYFLMLAFGLLGVMAILYLIEQMPLSILVGSFGFALLLIVISSLFPQLIKKGHIEHF